MKLTTLSVAACLFISMAYAQTPALVCFDNISITTDKRDFQPEPKNFDRLINTLIFGLDEKSDLNVAEQNTHKIDQLRSVTFRFDSSSVSKADFILSGRVFLSKDAAFIFDVRDLKSGKTHYLPPVHSSLDDLLSGSSKATNNLHDLITELNASRTSSSLRITVVADIKAEGRGKITEEEALSALYAIVDKNDFSHYGKLMSFDSLRTFSLNIDRTKIEKQANGQITLKLNFSKSKDRMVMRPVIYSNAFSNDSLTLTESVFDLFDTRQLASEKNDLLSLMDFMIEGNRLNRSNLKSLEKLMTLIVLPSQPMVAQYLDSAAKKPDYIYKTLLLIRKRIIREGGDYDSFVALAKLRLIQKRQEDASRSWILASQNTNDKTEKTNAFAQAAAVSYNAGRYVDALAMYENIEQLDPNFNSTEFGELNYIKGTLYCKLSQYDQAAKSLEKSLAVKPLVKPEKFPYENMYWLGFVYFYQGRTKDAIENLQKVYEWNHAYAEMLPVYLSDCYRNLAQENLTKGNYPNAYDMIQQSLKYKENRDSQLMLLRILNRLSRFSEARQYISARMNEPLIWRNQAKDLKVLYYSRNKNEFANEAIHLYRKYLANRNTDSLARYDIGNIYTSINKIDSAIHFFEEAKSLGFSKPDLFLDLAEAYIKNKKPAQALEVFKSANSGKKNMLTGERNTALKLYLSVVAKRFLKQDYETELLSLNKKFDANVKIVKTWSFDGFRKWMLASDASPEDKTFVDELTGKMIGISTL